MSLKLNEISEFLSFAKKLVSLSEKNYHLARKLKTTKKDLEKRDEELSSTRSLLLEKLVGKSPSTPGKHVPIKEMLMLYVNSVESSSKVITSVRC